MLSRGIQPSEVMNMAVHDFIFWLDRCADLSKLEQEAQE